MDRRTSLLGGRRSTDKTQWIDDLLNDLDTRSSIDKGASTPEDISDRPEYQVGPAMSAERIEHLTQIAKATLAELNRARKQLRAEEVRKSLRNWVVTMENVQPSD